MKIWIVSPFEPTPIDGTREMRFMGIANAALKSLYNVTFFSSNFRHSTKKFRFKKGLNIEVNKNYELVFLDSLSYKRHISLKRLFSHFYFSIKLKQEIKTREKPDIILTSLPTISQAFVLNIYSKKNNIPLVIDIIDPWPTIFSKALPTFLQRHERVIFSIYYFFIRNILKNSKGIISISKEYISWGLKNGYKGVNFQVYYPSVPFAEIQNNLNKIRAQSNQMKTKLKIIYAGSLGYSYDINIIIKTAKLFEERYPGKTEFVIAGAGPQSKLFEFTNLIPSNCVYLGRIEKEDLLLQFSDSDLGLMQHKIGASQTITYKLFDYLSAGLPILNSLQSEVVDFINENSIGVSNKPENELELFINIERLLKNPKMLNEFKHNALKVADKFGNSEIVYGNLIQFLTLIKNQ